MGASSGDREKGTAFAIGYQMLYAHHRIRCGGCYCYALLFSFLYGRPAK